MSRISPNFCLALFTACLIAFFCFLYPVWSATARMDILKQRPSSMMFEPVSKVVSNTRKFLLGRLESSRMKKLMEPSTESTLAETPVRDVSAWS